MPWKWAQQVSNLRPLPCEGSALPLSYVPLLERAGKVPPGIAGVNPLPLVRRKRGELLVQLAQPPLQPTKTLPQRPEIPSAGDVERAEDLLLSPLERLLSLLQPPHRGGQLHGALLVRHQRLHRLLRKPERALLQILAKSHRRSPSPPPYRAPHVSSTNFV